MKTLIVGAGIGGLALAAHLRKAGHDLVVVEKTSTWKHVGYILGLWPNGIRTLEAFGFPELVQQVGMPEIDEYMRDQSGAILKRVAYQAIAQRYGPVVLLLRSDLHEALRKITQGIPIRFGTTVNALEQRQESVVVTLSDGSQEVFDLVVGADGIHSKMRELLFGPVELSYTGLTMWIYLLPPGSGIEVPPGPNDLFGPGTYVGVFPSKDGTLCIYFGLAVPPGQPDPLEQRIARLGKLFGTFGWIVPDILHSLCDPAAIFHDDINQLLLEQWYEGRVVLLGDAAHAVAPTVGMGASMALEDAYVLAEELRRRETVEQALAAYVERRKPRVTNLRRASDFLNWFTLIKHPAAAWLRNTLVRSLPASLMLRDIEKIVATAP